jgi:hypothetical protein
MHNNWATTQTILRCTPNAKKKSQSLNNWDKGGVQALKLNTAAHSTNASKGKVSDSQSVHAPQVTLFLSPGTRGEVMDTRHSIHIRFEIFS